MTIMGNRRRRTPSPEVVKAYEEVMASFNPMDPADRKAVAEVIVFDMQEQIDRDNIIAGLGVDVRTFNLGQTPQWRTRKGIKVFTSQPGSYAPRSQMANRIQTLSTERHHAHPEIEITALQSGRYGDVSDLRDEALAQLLGQKYAKIWTTLVGSVSSGAVNYSSIASGATSAAKKNALDSGVDYVADQQDSDVTAIVGRRNALHWLADYEAYSTSAGYGYGPGENLKNQLDNTLYPATYRGIPVVYLNQYTDGYGINLISENEIFILGRGTLKLGVDLPLQFLEAIDVDNTTWHLNIFESYGAAVFDSTKNFRLQLTA